MAAIRRTKGRCRDGMGWSVAESSVRGDILKNIGQGEVIKWMQDEY